MRSRQPVGAAVRFERDDRPGAHGQPGAHPHDERQGDRRGLGRDVHGPEKLGEHLGASGQRHEMRPTTIDAVREIHFSGQAERVLHLGKPERRREVMPEAERAGKIREPAVARGAVGGRRARNRRATRSGVDPPHRRMRAPRECPPRRAAATDALLDARRRRARGATGGAARCGDRRSGSGDRPRPSAPIRRCDVTSRGRPMSSCRHGGRAAMARPGARETRHYTTPERPDLLGNPALNGAARVPRSARSLRASRAVQAVATTRAAHGRAAAQRPRVP